MAWFKSLGYGNSGGGGEPDTRLKEFIEDTLEEIDDSTITSIRNEAFNTSSIKRVHLPNVINVGYHAFFYAQSLVSVELENAENVGTNSGQTFYSCKKLETVYIPKVTSLPQQTFYECSSLKTFDTTNITSIASGAFVKCGFEVFDLKNTLTIPMSMFYQCSNLTVLILRGNSMSTLANTNAFGNTPFENNSKQGTLYVPQNLITTYQNNSTWSSIISRNNQILAIEGSPYENV